jgi:alpha-L-glutamate ligase-like protein
MSGKWKTWRANTEKILGMNRRNLHYIYPHNERRDYPLADNKLLTKKLLSEAGVPVPETYFTYQYFHEMQRIVNDLKTHDSFVIKPANGRGGGGIKVITKRCDAGWLDTSGQLVTLDAIRKQLLDIIFGVYSFDTHDTAIVEERLLQHETIDRIYAAGLADVRVVTCKHKPVMAMLRVPTSVSDGRANLHQGAIGIGIDLDTGRTTYAAHFGERISYHPDSNKKLSDIQLPEWQKLIQICHEASELLPLKYLGIDLAITQNGPVVLEANVRPGIEIQNANQCGLRPGL